MAYRKWKMQNGLWVICQEMPHTPLVAITIHSKGGSSVEGPNEIGLAHFMEHMAFKGSEKYPNEAKISGLIEQEGAEINAFTSHDRICFYIYTQANVELMFDILANAALRPIFREEDIEVERGPVLQEISESMDNPDDMFAKFAGKMLWGEHPYGGDILGTKAQVSSFGRTNFLDYYGKCFVPQDMALGVTGGIQSEKVFDLAFKYFCDGWEAGGERIKMPAVDYLYRPESKVSLLHKDFEQVKCLLGVPPQAWLSYAQDGEKERIATTLLANILGGGMSSRLFKKVRSQHGLVYYIGAGLNIFENAGTFCVYFGADQDNLPCALALIFSEINDILKNGITAEELAKVKNRQKTAYAQMLETPLGFAIFRGEAELHGTENISVEDFFKLRVDPIGVSDIMDVAKRLLQKENFYLAAMGKVGDHSKELEDLLGA